MQHPACTRHTSVSPHRAASEGGWEGLEAVPGDVQTLQRLQRADLRGETTTRGDDTSTNGVTLQTRLEGPLKGLEGDGGLRSRDPRPLRCSRHVAPPAVKPNAGRAVERTCSRTDSGRAARAFDARESFSSFKSLPKSSGSLCGRRREGAGGSVSAEWSGGSLTGPHTIEGNCRANSSGMSVA